MLYIHIRPPPKHKSQGSVSTTSLDRRSSISVAACSAAGWSSRITWEMVLFYRPGDPTSTHPSPPYKTKLVSYNQETGVDGKRSLGTAGLISSGRCWRLASGVTFVLAVLADDKERPSRWSPLFKEDGSGVIANNLRRRAAFSIAVFIALVFDVGD